MVGSERLRRHRGLPFADRVAPAPPRTPAREPFLRPLQAFLALRHRPWRHRLHERIAPGAA